MPRDLWAAGEAGRKDVSASAHTPNGDDFKKNYIYSNFILNRTSKDK